MYSKFFYYIFYSSAVMVYGIGLSKSTFESRSLENMKARYIKALIVVTSTAILTWLFTKGVLVPANCAELYPLFCIFIFVIFSVFSETLLRLTSQIFTSDFSVSLLCTVLAINESMTVVDTVIISVCSLSAFFLYTIVMQAIRKRMQFSSPSHEIEGRGLLLMGIAVLLLAMLAWNVTWFNSGVMQ